MSSTPSTSNGKKWFVKILVILGILFLVGINPLGIRKVVGKYLPPEIVAPGIDTSQNHSQNTSPSCPAPDPIHNADYSEVTMDLRGCWDGAGIPLHFWEVFDPWVWNVQVVNGTGTPIIKPMKEGGYSYCKPVGPNQVECRGDVHYIYKGGDELRLVRVKK